MPGAGGQPAGKGRTAVFTSDTTRNWQQVPRALDQESPFLRFWGQIDPLAGEPHRGDQGRGRDHGPDRQGLLRAGLADHRAGHGAIPRRERGPTRPRSSRRSRRPRAPPTPWPWRRSRVRRASYQGTFEPKRLGNLRDHGPGPVRRDALASRADDCRGRQAQPRVRPARPGRRDADQDRRRRRAAATSTSARPTS